MPDREGDFTKRMKRAARRLVAGEKMGDAPDLRPPRRADFQSAVSQVCNQQARRMADALPNFDVTRTANMLPAASRRYGRWPVCAPNLFPSWRFVFAAASWLLISSPPAVAAPLTFEKDIRPIFKAHCFECHGEGEKLKGGLDLRLRRLMLKGGDDGPVLVPGQPDKSLLFEKIHNGDMPKRDKKPTHV